MATLTSSYQYLGRSSVMTSVGGTLSYYILLYGKTTANNTTGIHTVTIKEVLASTNDNATFYGYKTAYGGTVAGKTVFSGNTEPNNVWELGSFTVGGVTYKTGTLIGEGSATVDATDGKAKDIQLVCSWKMNDTADSYTPANGTSRSVTVTATLTAIPRYLSITSLEISSKTETSAVVKWTTSDARSSTYYSFDNGTTWIGSATDGETLATNGKSGTFNINGLNANTTYNMKVKFRRADNDLWTESSTKTFTTYNYPYCTTTPDFTIGNALTLTLYNPLGRSVTVKGYAKTDNREIFNGSTNGTQLIGFNDNHSVGEQYASIPSSPNGQYKVVVSYGTIAMTRGAGNVYRIRGNETPTINNFSYTEGNNTIFGITGNKQHIVQNQSKLVAVIDPATPNYGAGSITKYVFECNGKSVTVNSSGNYELGTINSANNVELKVTVTDSRDLSATKSITVTMLEHSKPQANVTLKRLNNYENETYLTVDGSISSVNGKNTMTIKYQYKVSGGSYNALKTIGDNSKQVLQLDKNNIYIFNVVVTDAFNSKFEKEYTLGKGVFPLFIDTVKNSVGVNKFPVYEHSIEGSGLISVGEANSFQLESGESREIYIYFAGVTALVNFRMGGANLEIARLYYVFRPTQYFGVHKTLFDESFNNTGSVVPVEVGNATNGYKFVITNNHSSAVTVRYGILELC